MESKWIGEIARFDFSRVKGARDVTQNNINKAAAYLWGIGQGDRGTEEKPILFTDLTKKQKLEMVGAQLDTVITDMVRTQVHIEGQATADATSKADVENNY